MHINIKIRLEEMEKMNTIMKIEIHLILNSQIKFILELQMVGFMN
jgi:hypothetical protein